MRLWRLERAGYIRSMIFDFKEQVVWTLDKKGYQFVKSELPPLKEEGYLSDKPAHDLQVAVIHLGEGFTSELPGIKFFTEQELRRIEPEFYPSWVPTNNWRKTDGYWLVNGKNGHQVIALEVELNSKKHANYQEIIHFYNEVQEINKILWVIKDPSTMEKIQSSIEKVAMAERKHNFIMIEAFKTNGWQAKIISGPDSNKTINELLENNTLNTQNPFNASFTLDTSKCPHKSNSCKIFSQPRISN
jgi:hypothetical protein